MPIQAMWVPGYAAMLETPGGSALGDGRPMLNVDGIGSTDLTGLRRSGGATFRGKAHQGNWFHFAIPTPVWHSEWGRAHLVRVFVLFRLQALSARLTNVHVWDGPRFLDAGRRDHLSVPNPGPGITADNTWAMPDIELLYGLGLSVHIDFGTEDGDVTFTAAGADFNIRP